MILDTYLGVSLIQSDGELYRGLPVYYVTVAGKRYRFVGRNAYAKAQNKMGELINVREYN